MQNHALQRPESDRPAFNGVSPVRSDLRRRTRKFLECRGRRPRILVCCLDPDGAGTRRMARASAYADMGFDVDLVKRSPTAQNIARAAVENDVHVIDMVCAAGTAQHVLHQLAGALKAAQSEHIRVVADDVITEQEGSRDCSSGGVPTVGPGASAEDLARCLLDLLEDRTC